MSAAMMAPALYGIFNILIFLIYPAAAEPLIGGGSESRFKAEATSPWWLRQPRAGPRTSVPVPSVSSVREVYGNRNTRIILLQIWHVV